MTPRALTAMLTGTVLLTLAGAWSEAPGPGLTAAVATTPQDGGGCPLLAAQQTKSSKAWLKMMPVFRHPRCSNCHGGIPDPFPDSQTGNSGPGRKPYSPRHVGVVDIDSTSPANVCENCHMNGWTMPGSALYFVTKSDVELCKAMKTKFDGPGFVDHIRRESGGVQFIAAAFRGKRGLDADPGAQSIYEAETGKTFRAEPPPVTHPVFLQQAMAWVAAQGGDFVGDEECGCVPAETGEVYLLEIKQTDSRAFSGFVVTDQVTMQVRIEDTTVTVSALTNFASKATPETLSFPSGTISWIPDPIGIQNIVQVTGEVALDFPSANVRTLMLHFTHNRTRDPEFVQVSSSKPFTRRSIGGGPITGMPFSLQFGLLPRQKVAKVYETGKKDIMEGKLTLIKAPPAK